MVRPALTGRWPTCLACLRRLAQPLDNTTGIASVQVRAKSNYTRPQDRGVVVRLLEDIPKFGRKHAVFRTERGRMRNQWYPANKAEYMTRQRFRELAMTEEDVGERDRAYGILTPLEEGEDGQELSQAPAPTPAPSLNDIRNADRKAHSLIASLVPETLTFYRKPIIKPAPKPSTEPPMSERPRISPLVAASQAAIARKAEETAPETLADDGAPLGIYGSVSTLDIVSRVKDFLVADAEASRIALDPTSIHIVGVEDDLQKLKTLGRWEVEISAGTSSTGSEPVRKVVEILPSIEGQEDSTIEQ